MTSPVILLEQNVSSSKILSIYDKYNTVEFEAILQDLKQVKNNNGRIYSREDYDRALKEIQPLIEANRLLGEYDHPVKWMENPYRIFSVLYQDSSHVFKKVWLEGELVKGIGKTLPTPNGIQLKNLMLCPDVSVGFSLRADGNETYKNGAKHVTGLRIITWDAVSNPSHQSSKVIKYNALLESALFNNPSKVTALFESMNGQPNVNHVNYFINRLFEYAVNSNLKYWGI